MTWLKNNKLLQLHMLAQVCESFLNIQNQEVVWVIFLLIL